jgi:plastocyanin
MRLIRGTAVFGVTLALAACTGSGGGGGGAGTPTSAATAAATNSAQTAAAATAAATTSGGGGAPCADTTNPTTVSADVVGNTWVPATVNAKVGDVITWTNGDSVPHKVALDDGSCAMGANIAGGQSASLTFTTAGSFPFHCTVHPSMKGTIVIAP